MQTNLNQTSLSIKISNTQTSNYRLVALKKTFLGHTLPEIIFLNELMLSDYFYDWFVAMEYVCTGRSQKSTMKGAISGSLGEDISA